MAQGIPVQAVPSQTLQVQLANQACTLNIYQYAYGLFMDVIQGGIPVVTGVPCQNLNRIIRELYFGFVGDFIFVDTQGSADPAYTGLGTRFQLIYLTPQDLGGAG